MNQWRNLREMLQVRILWHRTGHCSCLWSLSCIISPIIYGVSAVQSAGAVKHVKKSLGVYFSGVLWFWGLCSCSRSAYPYLCVVLDSLEVCEIIKNRPLNYLVNWICFASSGTGS